MFDYQGESDGVAENAEFLFRKVVGRGFGNFERAKSADVAMAGLLRRRAVPGGFRRVGTTARPSRRAASAVITSRSRDAI